MVTRSIDNWEKHKEEVEYIIAGAYGKDRAKKFIDFYADRYDKFGRSYLHYKLAYWLMDDYHYVKRVGTRWYACVGTGGTGKTTILKNVFYFFDPLFNLKQNLVTTAKNLVLNLQRFPTIDSMRGCFMDEPDDSVYVSSKEGIILRSILGKARQQKLFLGICATDLKDIPPYIFRKLDGIIFCPTLGKCMFFKNRPMKKSYVLQEIRDKYSKEGYKIFFRLQKDKGCLVVDSIGNTPFDKNQEKEYLVDKQSDYEKEIELFVKSNQDKFEKQKEDPRNQLLINMTKQGMSQAKMGEILGLSRTRVCELIKKYQIAH